MNPQEQINTLTKRIELLEKGKDLSRSSDNEILNLYNKNLFDYFWRAIFFWQTLFESLDGFGVTGSAGYSITVPSPGSLDYNKVTIKTGATSGNTAELYKIAYPLNLASFFRKSRFRTALYLPKDTSQEVYIVVGILPNRDYYGFKIINNQIYGVTSDATAENSILLGTYDPLKPPGIEARYEPSTNVTFYINSKVSGVSNKNLPRPLFANGVESVNKALLDVSITTTTNETRELWFGYFEYLQFRNVLRT